MENSSESLIGRAYSLYGSGSFREARALCASILQQSPRNLEAFYLEGLARCRQGYAKVGARRIKKACSVFPELKKFDFMEGTLRHQGYSSIDVWEQRLFELKLFSTVDAFIVSYPKCGRTWVRLVLGKYALNGKAGDPLEVYQISDGQSALATLHVSHDDNPHYKPFTAIQTEKSRFKNKKVVFLVRDPRDVLVSYYFQYTLRGDSKIANDPDFNGTLSDFIRHEIGGLRSIVGFFNAWARQREVPQDFMLLRYEDLIGDPMGEYRRLIEFLGWPDHGRGALTAAISFGQFDKMKKLEREDTFNNVRLKPPEDGNPEGFKVRRGKVGGYVDYFSNDDLSFVNDFLQQQLDDFYEFYKPTPPVRT